MPKCRLVTKDFWTSSLKLLKLFRRLHLLRAERHRTGDSLRHRQRMGEEPGGGRPRLAHPHGVALHHRSPLLRHEDPGKILSRKTGHLGEIKCYPVFVFFAQSICIKLASLQSTQLSIHFSRKISCVAPP